MSRALIITTAEAENGVTESPANSNRTKYGVWYGLNGVKWCAIFVSWVYDHAGHHLEKIDSPNGYQSCQSGYNFWKKNNRLVKDPQAGDIVLYDWDGDGICDHTGIFAGWKDADQTILQAWEGNTEKGNDSDGGHVMLRERNRSLVRSFATPLVLDDVVSHPLNDILEKGDAGSAVSALQKLLTDLKFNITVDGIFGKQTEDAIRQFQKKHVLDVTGIVTPQVYGAIEEEASSPKVPVKKLTTGSFLHKGDAGSSVLVLQKALNKKGAVPTVAENGIFDAATVTAVKSFQKKNHLDVDGVVGPKTFAGLGVS